MDECYQQLKRLRGALEDMVGMWKPFGFGLLWPSPAAAISPAIWEVAEEEANKVAFAPCDLHLRVLSWLDPAPDRTYCIRWWGDKGGVKAFKGWCEKLWGFFNNHLKQAPDLLVPPVKPVLPSWDFRFEPLIWEPPSGYYWTLNAFGTVAAKNPHLTLTKRHEVLDTASIQVGQAYVQVIPTTQRSFEDALPKPPAVKILLLELEADAITFGSRLLDQLIADAVPNVSVDVERGVIYLKDIPVEVDRHYAQVVAVIVAANRGWVSGKAICEELELPVDHRIDRTIKKLPIEVRDQIETKPGKGYRLRHG